jgi:ATP diphosphatase
VFDAVRAELAELDEAHRAGDPTAVHHELGDVLLAVCNLARHLGVPPTAALDAANARFARRFRTLEAAVHADGLRVGQLPLPELEERWQAAKRVLAKQGEGA